MNSKVKEAMLFARNKHKSQKYGNKDYFLYHVQTVVDSISGMIDRTLISEEELDVILTTAFLHDVVEDCGVTITEIESKFGIEVATYVGLLTKKKNQSREEYLEQVSLCHVSSLVKLHDATVNATQCFSDGDMKRFAKYLGYMGKLGEVIKESY